jgi:peptidoglycan hydrolase-like protein with peptidoglycan-binding domain
MLREHGEPFSDRVSVMRANLVSVLALGLLTAACGSNETQRAATGGLTGIGAGALIGGPIGAAVGGAVGAVAGSAMPEGADTLTAKALHKEQGATAEALNDAGLGNGSSRSAQVSGKGSSVPTGQSSHLIKDAQAELQREGLYKGHIDGIDGPQTQQAVRDFQQREGLQQTAVLDQPTLERMNLTGEARTAERTGSADVAGSGTSSPPAALSANDIRSRLEQAGYTHVRDLQRQANLYTARAEQGDTAYRLRVDARSGQVLSQHRLAASQQSGAAPSAASRSSAAPGAVGSDNANANLGTTGTTSMPSSSAAAPSVAPSSGSSTPSTGAAASGTSSHASDSTPPTPDQQSGGGAGNTTGSNPSR